jgi:G:T-mismatch repair DNA endonuclease (very short patch repair protein)
MHVIESAEEKQELNRLQWEELVIWELDIRETTKNFIQCDRIGVPGEDYACFS